MYLHGQHRSGKRGVRYNCEVLGFSFGEIERGKWTAGGAGTARAAWHDRASVSCYFRTVSTVGTTCPAARHQTYILRTVRWHSTCCLIIELRRPLGLISCNYLNRCSVLSGISYYDRETSCHFRFSKYGR